MASKFLFKYRPAEESVEIQYLFARGGNRLAGTVSASAAFGRRFARGGHRTLQGREGRERWPEVSTTMACRWHAAKNAEDPEIIGKSIVPIVPYEARTLVS